MTRTITMIRKRNKVKKNDVEQGITSDCVESTLDAEIMEETLDSTINDEQVTEKTEEIGRKEIIRHEIIVKFNCYYDTKTLEKGA